jgi:hypothetical protein
MIILSMFVCSNALSIELKLSKNPKFCINCKYFIPDDYSNQFGKCSLFRNTLNHNYYLVNGEVEENYDDYQYCSIVRNNDNKCGVNGKLYKKKYVRKIINKN